MSIDQDSQLTGVVIGAAIAVHRGLGPGLDEVIYEQALSARLASQGVVHARQKALPLTYKGVNLDCGYRLDVLIENRLPVELKALETILPIHEAQLLTYLRLSDLPLGLLVNFDVATLKEGIRRRVQTRPTAVRPPGKPVPNLRFDALSGELLQAAFEVHRAMGPGLIRSVYEECLCHELGLRRISFTRAHRVALSFEGIVLDHTAEIPLLVTGTIPVFCLAVARLTKLHESRLLARMRQARSPYGFLLNFNTPVLGQGIRRLTLQ